MSRVTQIVRSHVPGARTIGVVVGVTLLAEVGSTFAMSQVSAEANPSTSSKAPSVHVEQHVVTDSPNDSSVSSQQSVSSSTSDSTSTAPSVHSSVSVNGQTIPVPANGEVHQTITNSDGGQTRIDVSTQSNSGTQSNGSSYTSINSFTQAQSINMNQNSSYTTGP